MDLGKSRVDVKKREEGDWVDNIPEFDGLRLKTRGAGNKDWRKLQSKLVNNTVPRQRRLHGLQPDDIDRINAILIRDTALMDWDGATNGDGSAVPFSKEKAYEYLCNTANGFLDAALWAATVVAEQTQDDTDDDAKN